MSSDVANMGNGRRGSREMSELCKGTKAGVCK